MNRYDPEIIPNRNSWLGISEEARIRVVKNFHENKKIELPDITLHAAMHVIVENQIGMDFEPSVRAMLDCKVRGWLVMRQCMPLHL
jgi:hypothetical protein